MSEKCKLCGKQIPETALHFSNQFAIDHNFCGWMCFIAGVGDEVAFEMLRQTRIEKEGH